MGIYLDVRPVVDSENAPRDEFVGHLHAQGFTLKPHGDAREYLLDYGILWVATAEKFSPLNWGTIRTSWACPDAGWKWFAEFSERLGVRIFDGEVEVTREYKTSPQRNVGERMFGRVRKDSKQ
jgi:hypothetical protein